MNQVAADHGPLRLPDAPPPQHRVTAIVCVRQFWVLLTPKSKVAITCALYRTPDGLELRAGQGEHDQLLVEKGVSNAAAEAYAAAWHRLALAKGYHDTRPVADERSLRERILQWLWCGHADTKHRTPPEIASMLPVNEHNVRRELAAMLRMGLVVRVLSPDGHYAYYPAQPKDR